MSRACVIGSGPNGLAAALVLAQAGRSVDVYEAEAEPGGAVRTLPLTLPGFLHDFGSAVHPLAIGSPFFSKQPLEQFGLEWIHGDAPLAHPLDDGTAVVLERNLDDAARALGADGKPWRRMMEPLAEHWSDFAEDALGPVMRVPKHPLRMAHFGLQAFQSTEALAKSHFATERARALFSGLAAHSFLSLRERLSPAIALVLGAAAHAVGWPVPRGGAGMIPRALIGYLKSMGGTVHTQHRVDRLGELDSPLTLCDTSPRQIIALAGERLTPRYRRLLQDFKYGPGAFKVDYALSQPVPWSAAECRRAITVHVGGTFEEIAAAEDAVAQGRTADLPFVLVAQPSLFDATRAPAGKHVLWAYCHVPNGSGVDMLERIEAQIERFAPGFRECVLARHVSAPAQLEAMDANLVGGDIVGGAIGVRQLLFRPTMRGYSTGVRGLYLCSASTPPGGGVHGMCGYHAASFALRQMK
jgi:phytoene dehydrogenase-like protein